MPANSAPRALERMWEEESGRLPETANPGSGLRAATMADSDLDVRPASEQAILADTFTPKQRGMAFAIYGIAVVTAPAIGPTLGGWITDNFSWRWIFFINIPVGILSLFLTSFMVDDPPYFVKERNERKKTRLRVDYWGIIFIALGLGFLQIVLDKGERDDWLASNFIRT